ncbi:hypothetical protein L1987_32674 [Smallanthus sonchifolius]|uniref:Uncharacterized protein n=1 Tax=Smallanthus sonchifolius TaxID=185202 RepID=A0ACB9HP77_9ASTR|nr:hypothetical protein L1987_32674 [Smallanthus sonchifolius]
MFLGLDADSFDLDSIIKSYVRRGNIGLTYVDFMSLHRFINDLFFGQEGLEKAGCKEEQNETGLMKVFKVFNAGGGGDMAFTVNLSPAFTRLHYSQKFPSHSIIHNNHNGLALQLPPVKSPSIRVRVSSPSYLFQDFYVNAVPLIFSMDLNYEIYMEEEPDLDLVG